MSKRTHQQQRDRSRAKRESDKLARRKRRSQVVIIVMVVLLVLSLVGAALVGLVAGDPAPTVDEPDDVDEVEEVAGPPADLEPCPPAGDTPEPDGQESDEAPALRLDPDAEVTATFVTTCGEVVVELLPDAAPVAVGNFVFLADAGYYDGTPFHRTQWDFVVQGGDPSGDGTGGPGYEIDDELELPTGFEPGPPEAPGTVRYPRGTLAMANRGPDTAGSQFFIVQADPDYPFPPLYTVFGRVLEGLDVVDRIAAGEEVQSIAVDPVVLLEVRIDGLPDDPQMEPGPDDDGDDPADDAEDGDDEGTDDEGADES